MKANRMKDRGKWHNVHWSLCHLSVLAPRTCQVLIELGSLRNLLLLPRSNVKENIFSWSGPSAWVSSGTGLDSFSLLSCWSLYYNNNYCSRVRLGHFQLVFLDRWLCKSGFLRSGSSWGFAETCAGSPAARYVRNNTRGRAVVWK